jgi:glutamate-1-semialdehyde 2,1-aminomutase
MLFRRWWRRSSGRRVNSASFGASTAAEGDLAELVMACYPAIEKLRFVSSGRRRRCRRSAGARGDGAQADHQVRGLLSRAFRRAAGEGWVGSGDASGIPGSAGVPEEIAQLTLALPYNDLAAVEAAFAAHPDEIAAVILEPVVGNAGCIAPAEGYLKGCGRLREHGALLIVDEVMTGFRLALAVR